jgi:hypothetical protein
MVPTVPHTTRNTMRFAVHVTDNHGERHLFVVCAKGEADAITKGKLFFKRQAPMGTWAVSARAERE